MYVQVINMILTKLFATNITNISKLSDVYTYIIYKNK